MVRATILRPDQLSGKSYAERLEMAVEYLAESSDQGVSEVARHYCVSRSDLLRALHERRIDPMRGVTPSELLDNLARLAAFFTS